MPAIVGQFRRRDLYLPDDFAISPFPSHRSAKSKTLDFRVESWGAEANRLHDPGGGERLANRLDAAEIDRKSLSHPRRNIKLPGD